MTRASFLAGTLIFLYRTSVSLGAQRGRTDAGEGSSGEWKFMHRLEPFQGV